MSLTEHIKLDPEEPGIIITDIGAAGNYHVRLWNGGSITASPSLFSSPDWGEVLAVRDELRTRLAVARKLLGIGLK